MLFTLSHSLEILTRTPDVLSSLLSDLSEEWINGNEGEGTWSAKEVVAHLIVCENTDWLPRAKIILSDQTDKTLEGIDMTAHFELARKNSLETLLNEFKTERENSLAALNNFHLQPKDFTKTAIHPQIHEVNLQQLLSTWVVHDLSHIAQVTRVMAKQYRNEVGPFKAFLKILQ